MKKIQHISIVTGSYFAMRFVRELGGMLQENVFFNGAIWYVFYVYLIKFSTF